MLRSCNYVSLGYHLRRRLIPSEEYFIFSSYYVIQKVDTKTSWSRKFIFDSFIPVQSHEATTVMNDSIWKNGEKSPHLKVHCRAQIYRHRISMAPPWWRTARVSNIYFPSIAHVIVRVSNEQSLTREANVRLTELLRPVSHLRLRNNDNLKQICQCWLFSASFTQFLNVSLCFNLELRFR